MSTHQSILPQPPTPLVGRRDELAQIAEQLADPACRLLTLLGPGGTGKTRLALAVAEAQQTNFTDGVAFVDLHALADPALLATAIGDALGLQRSPEQSAEAQLTAYLAKRHRLLVLDNFETVLDGALWLSTLLDAAPGVTLLVTSREPLRLLEEWQFSVSGLRFPDAPYSLYQVDLFPALELFCQQAQRVFPTFDFAREADDVVRVCRLVDGMPLAVELAAAWRRTLACADIADEIQRNLDFLETHLRNLPARHRSIRAICEQSWSQLDGPTRQIFARLAIFRSGFTREAAQAVAGASLPTLVALADLSLLVMDSASGLGPRFRLHELLRHFATEKLETSPPVTGSAGDASGAISVRQAHSDFYLAFLRRHGDALANEAQSDALATLAHDVENVRAAWLWAVEQNNWYAIDESLGALHHFFWIRSRSQEGRALLHSALAALPDEPSADALRGRLCTRIGLFDSFLGNSHQAETRVAEGLRLARLAGGVEQNAHEQADGQADGQAREQADEEALALNALGTIAIWRGDYTRGEQLLQQSLAVHQQRNSTADEADVLCSLARLHALSGSYAQACTLADKSLSLLRRLPNASVHINASDTQAHALDVLGWATFCLGEYDRADHCYRQSLSLFEALGHKLGRVLALGGIGSVAWARGGDHLHEAESLMAQSVALCREIGQRQHLATHLWWSAQVALDLGDCGRAQSLSQEGLAIAEELDNAILCAFNASALGATRCATGDWAASWQWLRRAAESALNATTQPPLTITAFYMADVLAASPAHAAEAHELADSIIEHRATWHAFRQRALDLRKRLEPSVSKKPAQRPLSAQIHILLDTEFDFHTWSASPAPAHDGAGQPPQSAANQSLVEPLTERELEVLALVAEGCTNKEIAEQLIVTVGTVKWYTNTIYGKLAVKNRTQAVAHAREMGLLAM